jgi:3-phosphoshikimate 1-carboxyvinyltransferase
MKITPSTAEGIVTIPSSKSVTHRALICSALSEGKSKILSPLVADDTEATIRVLQQLGAQINSSSGYHEVIGGAIDAPTSELFCGESGTTLRLVLPLCGLTKGETTLTGGPSLSKRPVAPLISGLNQLGVNCNSSNGYPPVKVNGKGSIHGGLALIRGDISSQFVSGLLLIAPLTEVETIIRLTTPLQSKPYVDMTLNTLKSFNIEVTKNEDMTHYKINKQKCCPTDFEVEGDWSSAAFMLAAGALTGDVTVNNLKNSSYQADKAILNILEEMCAEIDIMKNQVRVKKSVLNPITYNLENSPDLFPVVTTLCACAKGVSRLTGLSRLKYKESDRLAAMIEGLRRMMIKVTLEENGVLIEGGKPQGAKLDPFQDHRIAMALAILALNAEGETLITDSECVSKSYPHFWRDLTNLGASIRSNENE